MNGKYYIGVHNETNPYYLGSGSIIKDAINKYGTDCFSREILFETDDIDLAYLMESELVTKIEINDPECYNLRLGGFGGRTGISDPSETRKKKKESFKNSPTHAIHLKNVSKYTRKKRSDIMKARRDKGFDPMKSEDSREKVSMSKIGTKALWKDGKRKMARPGSQKWIDLENQGFVG